jgi:hypothetical protein
MSDAGDRRPGRAGTPPDTGNAPQDTGDTPPGAGGTPPGAGGTSPGAGDTPTDTDNAPPGAGGTPALERGRDLMLLALALVVVVEGSFAAYAAVRAEGTLAAGAGRFALISGMSWMTWQGFAFSRWLLVVLAGFAAVGAPLAIRTAVQDGGMLEAMLMGVAGLGYAAAALLLAVSHDVGEYARARRRERDQGR